MSSKPGLITASLHNNNNHQDQTIKSNNNKTTQVLSNNGAAQVTPLRKHQRDPDDTLTTTTRSTGNTNNHRIWLYFEQLQPRPTTTTTIASDTKVEPPNFTLKCLLCSTEFETNAEPAALRSSSSTISLLWNHLRVKHAIERDVDEFSNNSKQTRMKRAYSNSNSNNNNNNNNQKHNNLSTGKTIANSHNTNSNMTNIKPQSRRTKLIKDSSANNKNPATNTTSNNINDLRRNLDLFEYDDMFKASLKPLPTTSLSRNLFDRLNQLSSPVTRKLKFWNKKSFQVNQYNPCFKVIYLGNLGIQFWSKDESCLEKPLNTLWNNYLVNMKTEIVMRLTICNSGLEAITRQHGLTQYWSNRLVYCCSHKNYPKIFAWIYRHEGKKMRQELRCHAVFCSSPERASKMVSILNQRLACALQEFKREKKCRGNSLNIVTQDGLPSSPNSSASLLQRTVPRTIPLRRQILAKGSANFRPPLERSKSAPKLTSIREEDYELEEEEEEDGDGDGDYDDESEDQQQQQQHDEFEYEQSFGDRDEEENDSDYEDDDLGNTRRDVDDHDQDSSHKLESNSLTASTVNEETSNSSSVCAAGDISYDNIIVNRHHLAANHERLETESVLTAPIELTSSSSLRRQTSLRGSRHHQRSHKHHMRQQHSLDASSGEPNDSMSDGQRETDIRSPVHYSATSTLNSCHINNRTHEEDDADSIVVYKEPANTKQSLNHGATNPSANIQGVGGTMVKADHHHHHRQASSANTTTISSLNNINIQQQCELDPNQSSKDRVTGHASIPVSKTINSVEHGAREEPQQQLNSSKILIRTTTTATTNTETKATTTPTSHETARDGDGGDNGDDGEADAASSTQDIILSWSNNLLIK